MTNNIKLYLKILIGLCIIIYIMYNKLFRIRLPRELYTSLSNVQILLYGLVAFSTVFLLVYNCYKLYNNYYKKIHKQSKYSTYIRDFLKHPKNPLLLWKESLISLDIFIKNKVPQYDVRRSYIHVLIEKIAKLFSKYEKLSIISLLVLRIVPQIISCTCFGIDILIYHKFYYFYKSLWILLIPLLVSYIVYSIEIDTDTHLESLDNFLVLKLIKRSNIMDDYKNDLNNDKIFTQISVNQWFYLLQESQNIDKYICYNTLSEKVKKRISNEREQYYILNNCLDSMKRLFIFRIYLIKYEQYKGTIETPFNILKYAIYALGWFYILLYGTNFILLKL